MSKKLGKYIASFDHFDKSLIVLSVITGRISIASFVITVIGASLSIANARFSLAFSIFLGIINKSLKLRRNKKKKHNEIVMLARSKINSIEIKISEALTNNEINHEDFMTINYEERNYRESKDSIRIRRLKKDIGKIVKQNELINNRLKSKI